MIIDNGQWAIKFGVWNTEFGSNLEVETNFDIVKRISAHYRQELACTSQAKVHAKSKCV